MEAINKTTAAQTAAKEILVLYHDRCMDGTAAAWCFYQKLGRENADYIAVKHETDAINKILSTANGKFVYLLDYCFEPHDLKLLTMAAQRVIVLDHHESAKAIESPKAEFILDMKRSGCQIAWDYLNSGTSRPWFIDYIADKDLYLFKLPHSAEISDIMHRLPIISNIEKFGEEVSKYNKDTILNVSALLPPKAADDFSYFIKEAVKAEFTSQSGRKYICSIVAVPASLKTKVLNHICETDAAVDFAASYIYNFAADEYWISARAIKPDVNLVTAFECLYKTGGHKGSAGFTIRGSDKENMRDYFIISSSQKECGESIKNAAYCAFKCKEIERHICLLVKSPVRIKSAALLKLCEDKIATFAASYTYDIENEKYIISAVTKKEDVDLMQIFAGMDKLIGTNISAGFVIDAYKENLADYFEKL